MEASAVGPIEQAIPVVAPEVSAPAAPAAPVASPVAAPVDPLSALEAQVAALTAKLEASIPESVPAVPLKSAVVRLSELSHLPLVERVETLAKEGYGAFVNAEAHSQTLQVLVTIVGELAAKAL